MASIGSQVAAVRNLYAAFGEGNVDGMLALIAPNVDWLEPDNPFNPAAGSRRGHAGFREWYRIGRESEQIISLEPRRFIADGDIVAVLGHMQCRARPTGRTYESDFVHVVTFDRGLVVRFQEFFDTYAAGEAFR